MRTKDMNTGDVVAVGRGYSNRLVVVVRAETWTEKHDRWSRRPSVFAKGRGSNYDTSIGVLVVETEIHCGSQGYYADLDPEDKRVATAIKRATKEAKRLAALSDEDLAAHLSGSKEAVSGKFGRVRAVNPSNITDTLDGLIEAVAANKESEKRKAELRRERAAELDGYTDSIEESLAKLGGSHLRFIALLQDGTKFYDTKALAAFLAEVAAR